MNTENEDLRLLERIKVRGRYALASIGHSLAALPSFVLWLIAGRALMLACPPIAQYIEGVLIATSVGYTIGFSLGKESSFAQKFRSGLWGALIFLMIALVLLLIGPKSTNTFVKVAFVSVPASVGLGIGIGVLLGVVGLARDYEYGRTANPGCFLPPFALLFALLTYLMGEMFFKWLVYENAGLIMGAYAAVVCTLMVGTSWHKSKSIVEQEDSRGIASSENDGRKH